MTRTVQIVLIVSVAAVLLILVVLGILIGAGVAGWKSAVRQTNEAAAVANLRAIDAAERQYYNRHNRRFGSFVQLVNDHLLDARYAGGEPIVDGYAFQLKLISEEGLASNFVVNADPESDQTGSRHFYIESKDSVVRSNAQTPATSSDPAYVK